MKCLHGLVGWSFSFLAAFSLLAFTGCGQNSGKYENYGGGEVGAANKKQLKEDKKRDEQIKKKNEEAQ